MVLDPVPPGVTVVGIPARAVDRARATAGGCKPGFDCYGMPADADMDPILGAVESLRAELCELEARFGQLAASRTDSPS